MFPHSFEISLRSMEFNYKNKDRLMEERKIEKKKIGLFLAVPFIFLP